MIFNQSFLRIFGLLAILNVITGCSGDADNFRQSVIAGGLDIQEFVVTPDEQIKNAGETLQYTANAKLGDELKRNFTSTSSWSSSDSAIASIDSSGFLTAIQDGVVTITARFANYVDSVQLKVSTANLRTIEIEGPTQVDKCRSFQYKAFGQFDDDSRRPDIDVAWSVNGDQNIATISDEADSKGQLTTTQSGSFNVIATQGVVVQAQEVIANDNLTAIAVVDPSNASIAKNDTRQLEATATYLDGGTEDISSIATWTSDNAGIASVESKTGVVKGVAAGSATISAACGGVQGSAAVTVTGQSSGDLLRINDGKDFSLKEDEEDKDKLKLTLTLITDNDSKDVTEDASWSVDSNSLSAAITVSDSKGSKGEMKITPGNTGATIVVASYEGLTQRIQVTIEAK